MSWCRPYSVNRNGRVVKQFWTRRGQFRWLSKYGDVLNKYGWYK